MDFGTFAIAQCEDHGNLTFISASEPGLRESLESLRAVIKPLRLKISVCAYVSGEVAREHRALQPHIHKTISILSRRSFVKALPSLEENLDCCVSWNINTNSLIGGLWSTPELLSPFLATKSGRVSSPSQNCPASTGFHRSALDEVTRFEPTIGFVNDGLLQYVML